jgi:hypothetical protein
MKPSCHEILELKFTSPRQRVHLRFIDVVGFAQEMSCRSVACLIEMITSRPFLDVPAQRFCGLTVILDLGHIPKQAKQKYARRLAEDDGVYYGKIACRPL